MRPLAEYGKHIAVSITNKCPIQCGHCVSDSSPGSFEGSKRLLAAAENMILSWTNVRHLTLTGGEPFSDLKRLRDFIELARERNIWVGAITSAFWAKSDTAVQNVLKHAEGLASLTISTDVYHQAFVRTDFVKRAYLAAKQKGISAHIRLTRSQTRTAADIALHETISEFCEESDLEDALLVPYGRAAALEDLIYTGQEKFGTCPASGPHLFEDGTLTPCCNSIVSLRSAHPLNFGSVETSGATSTRQSLLKNDFFLAIKIFGFDFLKNYLTATGQYDFAPRSACDFCFMLCDEERLFQRLTPLLKSREFRLKLHTIALTEHGNEASADIISEIAGDLLSDRLSVNQTGEFGGINSNQLALSPTC